MGSVLGRTLACHSFAVGEVGIITTAGLSINLGKGKFFYLYEQLEDKWSQERKEATFGAEPLHEKYNRNLRKHCRERDESKEEREKDQAASKAKFEGEG